VKEELALELVARYHGKDAALEAAREFDRVHREKGLPDEKQIEKVTLNVRVRESIKVGEEGVAISYKPANAGVEVTPLTIPISLITIVLKVSGLAPSTSEARRLITQGGVQVDGEKVTDANLELAVGKSYLLKVGKRRFKRVTLSE
jgi:tyrosyl-tRNA synthetase